MFHALFDSKCAIPYPTICMHACTGEHVPCTHPCTCQVTSKSKSKDDEESDTASDVGVGEEESKHVKYASDDGGSEEESEDDSWFNDMLSNHMKVVEHEEQDESPDGLPLDIDLESQWTDAIESQWRKWLRKVSPTIPSFWKSPSPQSPMMPSMQVIPWLSLRKRRLHV